MQRVWLLGVLLLSFWLPSQGEARTRVAVHEDLTVGLNQVLASASELHQILTEQSSVDLEKQLRVLHRHMQEALELSHLSTNRSQHLRNVLIFGSQQVEAAHRFEDNRREGHLIEAFKQIVELARHYRLQSYPIFFCNNNRSVWIQSGNRARNPFSPGNSCAVRLR